MAFSTIPKRLAKDSDSRFARITANDHSAKLWVVALLSTIYAILVLAIRLGFTKWKAYSLDDVIVTTAYVRTVLLSTQVPVEVRIG
jgi:anti-sigma-K factor RskA